jgi:hypothetical protein
MNAYGSTSLFGMLLATSVVSGATAMEINQQRAPATSEAPAFTLPVFLDGERLPDLQQAWRTHFSDTSEAAPAQAAGVAATIEADAALNAAQQAMTRAEQAGREAAEVRVRAEELSRRFGAGATEQAPTETAAIDTQNNSAGATEPAVEHVLAPADDEAPPPEASAATGDAPVIEEMATPPVKKPVKRVSAPIPSRQAVQTVARQSASVVTGPLRVDPAAPKPETDPMMPSELRSFGWNAQPQ